MASRGDGLSDLIWPIFLLLGWEEVRVTRGPTPFLNLDFVSYPISYSLATTIGWALSRSESRANARTIPWFGLASWILPVWAGWFDRHRRFLPDAPRTG